MRHHKLLFNSKTLLKTNRVQTIRRNINNLSSASDLRKAIETIDKYPDQVLSPTDKNQLKENVTQRLKDIRSNEDLQFTVAKVNQEEAFD